MHNLLGMQTFEVIFLFWSIRLLGSNSYSTREILFEVQKFRKAPLYTSVLYDFIDCLLCEVWDKKNYIFMLSDRLVQRQKYFLTWTKSFLVGNRNGLQKPKVPSLRTRKNLVNLDERWITVLAPLQARLLIFKIILIFNFYFIKVLIQ